MDEHRITIKDIAEQLGLSTATVSNVIHGKTQKISERTVKKVQQTLETSGYIPNMAAVLLAQNSSKIVCVMLSNDARYENRMLEDSFVSGLLNGLSKEIASHGYFMMLKEEPCIANIGRYASMWNMAGIILVGYCEQDYQDLRQNIRVPFVVVDSYSTSFPNYSDVGIDNIRGGFLAGEHLLQNGHTKVLYLANNTTGCDHHRYLGLHQAFAAQGIAPQPNDLRLVSATKAMRQQNYHDIFADMQGFTAAFCACDAYAIEFMQFLAAQGVRLPDEFSIIGFDDIPLAACVQPALTTVAQDLYKRAECAVELLEELIQAKQAGRIVLLPVELVVRDSVKNLLD